MLGLKRITNDDARRTFNNNSEVKLKTTILKSSLCDCIDAYMHVKGIIIYIREPEDVAAGNK